MNKLFMSCILMGLLAFLLIGTNVVKAKDKNDALHEAIGSFKRQEVQKLLDEGADVEGKIIGTTPLMFACRMRDSAVVRLLIERGANVNARSDFQMTPLMNVCCSAVEIRPGFDIVKLLIHKGADINVKNNNGETALRMACRCNSKENAQIAKILLDNGADVNTKNLDGETALMAACGNSDREHAQIAKILLDNGADVNAKDLDGKTALMAACGNRSYDEYNEDLVAIVKLLLARGADVNVKDMEGKTAAKVATEKGNYEIVNLLKAESSKSDRQSIR